MITIANNSSNTNSFCSYTYANAVLSNIEGNEKILFKIIGRKKTNSYKYPTKRHIRTHRFIPLFCSHCFCRVLVRQHDEKGTVTNYKLWFFCMFMLFNIFTPLFILFVLAWHIVALFLSSFWAFVQYYMFLWDGNKREARRQRRQW